MKISDSELLVRVQALVAEEASATARVIECLEEIERRRLYLEKGYSSLLVFAVEFLGYSEPAALRRISAMRIVRDVPSLKPAVESGALSLTTLTQAQRFFRMGSYTPEEKKSLVLELKDLTTREVERALTVKNPEFARKEILKPVNATLTEVRFLAEEELISDLKRIQELWGLRTLEETLTRMAKLTLQKVEAPIKKIPISNPETRVPGAPLRRTVFQRDGKCTYQDRKTGKRCGSSYGLEVDHRQPYAMGGKTEEQNLRLLCRAHHRFVTREAFPVIRRRAPSAPKVERIREDFEESGRSLGPPSDPGHLRYASTLLGDRK